MSALLDQRRKNARKRAKVARKVVVYRTGKSIRKLVGIWGSLQNPANEKARCAEATNLRSREVVFTTSGRFFLRYREAANATTEHFQDREFAIAARAVQSSSRPEPIFSAGLVLETLEGFVDVVDGETAFVTLRSESGEVLQGQYPAIDLAKKGIRERRRFICRTVRRGDNVEVDLAPVPDVQLTPVEVAAINRDIKDLVAGSELDDDY